MKRWPIYQAGPDFRKKALKGLFTVLLQARHQVHVCAD